MLTVKPGFVKTDMVKDARTPFWVVSPEQAAEDICKAMRKRKQDIYVPARWRWMMLIIRTSRHLSSAECHFSLAICQGNL